MRLPTALAAATAAALATSVPAYADAPPRTFKASATLSRHHTTNALDSPLAVPDWYTQLRGALEETLVHELGTTRIAGEFQVRRYDRYSIEDDATASALVETTVRLSDRLELRGTLSLRAAEEGDELPLGNAVIGMRTGRIVAAAALQAGVRLFPDTTLVVETAASRDMPGDTRFQDDLLPAQPLEPLRERLRAAATLTRTEGAFSYGLFAGAGLMRARAVGLLPQIDVADYAIRAHAALKLDNGPTLAAAAGLAVLDVPTAAFRETRPTYEITAALPLAGRLTLRGALKAAYDMASNDDPVAVWLRRVEAEAVYAAGPRLTLAAGFFRQERDFIGLGGGETGRGLYGEASWQAHERLALVLRVDATRHVLVPLGIGRRAIDAQIALRANL
ncbi:MAG: hypothetical protein M9895_07255 [Aquamicrobium sp.]|uniref:hypothetical protein n=1 Tax=Aquamicrobium sp. TaxID=1872579 RepID=UPI00349E9A85|nr:hypothetical protein [Aquamicrobium sp.]MCO5158084.1 hypothetical protein [Aquamicrobium sp.]